jgi:hypothetical protein
LEAALAKIAFERFSDRVIGQFWYEIGISRSVNRTKVLAKAWMNGLQKYLGGRCSMRMFRM